MPLGMEVGLSPGDFVLDGDQAPPQFSAHVHCGQTGGWIKMPLGMEVGLRPGDFVLDGDPAPLAKKEAEPTIFGPCLLLPNGWMDQDGTWHGGGSRSRSHCARWGPSYASPQKRGQSPQFSAHVYCCQTAGWIKILLGMEVGLILCDTVSMRERWSCEHTLSILSINRLTLRQQQQPQPQQPRPLMDSAHDILHPPPSRKPLWTDNPVISVIMYTVARRQFSGEPFRYSTTIS